MARLLGKVLLIDPDVDARTLLADGLRELRWVVETAATARMGIEAATMAQPDIVVTDLALPDVPSLNFARTLRTFIEHDIHVVGITDDFENVDRLARAAGFDDVFAKPCDVTAIHTRLLSCLAAEFDASESATTEIPKLRR